MRTHKHTIEISRQQRRAAERAAYKAARRVACVAISSDHRDQDPDQNQQAVAQTEDVPDLAMQVAELETAWREMLAEIEKLQHLAAQPHHDPEMVWSLIESVQEDEQEIETLLTKISPLAFKAYRDAELAGTKAEQWRYGSKEDADTFMIAIRRWTHHYRLHSNMQTARLIAVYEGRDWTAAVVRAFADGMQNVPAMIMAEARMMQAETNRNSAFVANGALGKIRMKMFPSVVAALIALGEPGQHWETTLRRLAAWAAWEVQDKVRTPEQLGAEMANLLKREAPSARPSASSSEFRLVPADPIQHLAHAVSDAEALPDLREPDPLDTVEAADERDEKWALLYSVASLQQKQMLALLRTDPSHKNCAATLGIDVRQVGHQLDRLGQKVQGRQQLSTGD